METSYKKKTKEERQKETERLNAESRRAQAVVQTKRAHKLIEDVEKSRNLQNVVSLSMRIAAHFKEMETFLKMCSKIPIHPTPITSLETTMAQNIIETYKSIREDFKKVIGFKNEEEKVLFPKKNTSFETREQMINVVSGLPEQENQMNAYLMRKIP